MKIFLLTIQVLPLLYSDSIGFKSIKEDNRLWISTYAHAHRKEKL